LTVAQFILVTRTSPSGRAQSSASCAYTSTTRFSWIAPGKLSCNCESTSVYGSEMGSDAVANEELVDEELEAGGLGAADGRSNDVRVVGRTRHNRPVMCVRGNGVVADASADRMDASREPNDRIFDRSVTVRKVAEICDRYEWQRRSKEQSSVELKPITRTANRAAERT
jgi:hypothetical protein